LGDRIPVVRQQTFGGSSVGGLFGLRSGRDLHIMRMKKPVVALSAVALLALAACGSGNTGPSAPVKTNKSLKHSGKAGEAMDPTRQAPAPPIPGAKKGGTLTVLSVAGSTTFDPTEVYYTNTASIESGLVIRSLTQYVYDPKSKQMVLIPDLATDLGQHNADFTKWTFTLRSGVKFENGQPVTAQDLEYGIERSFDRATFPGGANYSNQYFLDGDTYKGPYKSPGDYKGVTIKGNTITIKMARPFPDMPYWGSFPAMSPIPPGSASDPAKYKNHPWATGPYMFKDYVPGQSLTLVRNPYWDADTDPGRHQYIDQFDFDFATSSAKIDATMLADTGPGQTTISYDPVLAADYQKFSQQAAGRLIVGGQPCTSIWYPDNRKITDVDVRRAIAWAYPYQAAWAAGGYIQGVTRVPGSNVMPPGIPGRMPYNPLPGHEPGSTDTAKAHALLQKAGQLGYELKFAYQTDVPESVAVKNVIAQSLQQAGFTVTPVATTSANYVANYLQNPSASVNVRSSTWCSDWPSGSSWMPPEFQTTDIAGSGFGANYAAFSNKAIDNRMRQIQLLPLDQQPAAWNALDEEIQKKYFPVVVTGYGGDAMMRGSKVHGFNDDDTLGMPTFKDMWVS
jgi:peptide/nickel transport system substrate-binding protein